MIRVWYQVHAEGVGWSDWEVKKIEKDESFYGACKGMGYSNQQIVKIYEAIEKTGYTSKELMEAVEKAMRPVIEPICKWFQGVFEFYYSPPEKKKIYQIECRMKNNLKNYGYAPNYRGRMFCVGDRGNYRRF